ncbi:MAG: ABC transporter ATP-binding protein C-terminal domain-containing protein, partial [Actinomycetota bacterium]
PLGALRLRSRSTEAAETADQLLAFTGLGGLADRRASDLNMGQLRRLELARALAGRPRLLLLDEPAAGIGADGMPELARLIDSIHARGVTVLLVEHHVGFALSLCDRAVVLDEGRMIAEGDPEVIRTDPRVITAYLGRAPAVARKVPTKPSGNPAEDAAEPSPFGTEHR